MKDALVGVLVVVVAFMGYVFATMDTGTQEEPLGAFPGPEILDRVITRGGLAEGGVFTIATTASSMTLKDRDLATAKTISISAMGAGQAALALTLPASTTWSSLPQNGTAQSWIIDSVGTAAATTTTITAGTGVDIDGITANDDVINGGVSGELQCWRLPNGDIRCIVNEYVDAG